MRLVDTHSHLYEPEFDADRDQAVARAREAGVERLLFPAIDPRSHDRMVAACRRYGDYCLPMMGLHPTSVNDNPQWRAELEETLRNLENPPEGIARWWGVGEIGLDFHWSAEWKAEQIEVFEQQCRAAVRLGLPVAIHTRDAWPEMVGAIERLGAEARAQGSRLRGVFHAFSGDAALYRRLREAGDFRFGIGGPVTFKKSPLAGTVREMALEEIVLETDCPYLTPVPRRGERNESAYVAYVCAKVAELKGLSADETAEVTTRNAEALFGFETRNGILLNRC